MNKDLLGAIKRLIARIAARRREARDRRSRHILRQKVAELLLLVETKARGARPIK